MLNLKKAALSAVAVMVVCGAMASAQTTGGRVPQTGPKMDGGATAKLTTDQLGNLLKSMGYQMKSVPMQGGFVILQLDVPAKGRTIPLDIALSKDGTKVWLTVLLAQAPQGDAIPANIMRQMLELNSVIGPNFFQVNKTGQIRIQCAIDNNNLTTEQLRRSIDLICQDCVDFENVWNPQRWGTGGR